VVEFELYRQMIEELSYQVPRISPDQLRPVNDIASSLQPLASSFTVALGVLRESILVRSTPPENAPQASYFVPPPDNLVG
jgi:hypothetical protein